MSETLVIIVPSKGRPDNISDLARALHATGTTADLWVVLDEDAPGNSGYDLTRKQMQERTGFSWRVATVATSGLGPALNQMATALSLDYRFFCFMGDDHRPRTTGWDGLMVQALREMGTGLVYGNDLLMGERLPTAVAMTQDIVLALNGMVPKGLRHLFFDNFWFDLGHALDAIRYLPGVIIEHMHPLASKGAHDETYEKGGMSGSVYESDLARYEQFKTSGEFGALVERLR